MRRKAIINGIPSTLSSSTAFLVGAVRNVSQVDAQYAARENHEQARVLVSLLVSITFLSLELSIRPLQHVEDHILAAVVQLTLIILYTSILLIKVCVSSSEACAPFGFGDSPKGIFLFFVYFGVSMLLLQLVVGAAIMYTTGHVPKLLLLAKAHGVSPWIIFQRTSARRARFLKLRVVKFLRLDQPYLTPAAAAAVLKYRGGHDGVKAVSEPLSQFSLCSYAGVCRQKYRSAHSRHVPAHQMLRSDGL
eukprot:7272586-Prymnesium_polylepis.4